MPKKDKSMRDITHDSMPASVGLVKEVREELRAEIRSVREDLKSEIHAVKAEVQKVLVSVHQSQVLMEEQRSENRIVLDGLKNMMERQDRIEEYMVTASS